VCLVRLVAGDEQGTYRGDRKGHIGQHHGPVIVLDLMLELAFVHERYPPW
jgi:hypothetical protein